MPLPCCGLALSPLSYLTVIQLTLPQLSYFLAAIEHDTPISPATRVLIALMREQLENIQRRYAELER